MTSSCFKQTDITRALKAADKAGFEVAAAKIEKVSGDIILTFGVVNSKVDNPCDEVLP